MLHETNYADAYPSQKGSRLSYVSLKESSKKKVATLNYSLLSNFAVSFFAPRLVYSPLSKLGKAETLSFAADGARANALRGVVGTHLAFELEEGGGGGDGGTRQRQGLLGGNLIGGGRVRRRVYALAMTGL